MKVVDKNHGVKKDALLRKSKHGESKVGLSNGGKTRPQKINSLSEAKQERAQQKEYTLFSGKIKQHSMPLHLCIGVAFSASMLGVMVVSYFVVLSAIIFSVLSTGVSTFFWQTIPTLPSLIFSYALPIVLGSITFLFLLRPLFPRHSQRSRQIAVNLVNEKRLKVLVGQLSKMIGVEYPSDIVITNNTEVSLQYTSLLGVHKNETVLFLGMPLLYTLSTKQIAGLIARELGHYRQPYLRHLRYFIRVVNRRLDDCSNDNDGWIQWLDTIEDNCSNTFGRAVYSAIRFFVSIVGHIMRLVTIVAGATSTYVARKIELDADKYAISVAGSKEFIQSFTDIALAQYAMDEATHKILGQIGHRQLVNDMPSLIKHYFRTASPQVVEQAREHAFMEQRSWLSALPNTRDRIIQAEELSLPAFLRLDLCAYQVLHDARRLCECVTLLYYQELGLSVRRDELVDVRQLMASATTDKKRSELIHIYYNGWFDPSMFWNLQKLEQVRELSHDERKALLNETIANIRHSTPDFVKVKNSLTESYDQYKRTSLILETRKTLGDNNKGKGLTREQMMDIAATHKKVKFNYESAKEMQIKYKDMMGLRLCLAAAIHKEKNDRLKSLKLISMLASIEPHARRLSKLRVSGNILPDVIQSSEAAANSVTAKKIARDLHFACDAALRDLRSVTWPFHSEFDSVADFIKAQVKVKIDVDNPGVSPLERARYYQSVWMGICEVNVFLNSRLVSLVTKAETENNIDKVKLLLAS